MIYYMADLNELMEKIRLAKQNSSNVVFPRAQLQGVELRGANLRGADLFLNILFLSNLTN